MFVPIAIILKADMETATEAMAEVAALLELRFGEEYGITLYEGGTVMPIIAFYNDHDDEAEEATDVQ